METSVARCFERKGERISDGVREREEKGRKSSEKYVFVTCRRSGDR